MQRRVTGPENGGKALGSDLKMGGGACEVDPTVGGNKL